MDAYTIADMVTKFGFPTILAIVLMLFIRTMIKDMQKEASEREKKLGDRIDELEDRDREAFVKLVSESTEATREHYRSLRRWANTMSDLNRNIGGLPCVTGESFWPHPALHAKHNVPKPQPTGETTEETNTTDRKEKDKT